MPRFYLRVHENIESIIPVDADTLDEAQTKFMEGQVDTTVRFSATADRIDWNVIEGWEDLEP